MIWSGLFICSLLVTVYLANSICASYANKEEDWFVSWLPQVITADESRSVTTRPRRWRGTGQRQRTHTAAVLLAILTSLPPSSVTSYIDAANNVSGFILYLKVCITSLRFYGCYSLFSHPGWDVRIPLRRCTSCTLNCALLTEMSQNSTVRQMWMRLNKPQMSSTGIQTHTCMNMTG